MEPPRDDLSGAVCLGTHSDELANRTPRERRPFEFVSSLPTVHDRAHRDGHRPTVGGTSPEPADDDPVLVVGAARASTHSFAAMAPFTSTSRRLLSLERTVSTRSGKLCRWGTT